AIIKHLSKNGLKTYTSTVEKSSVSFEVDSLSPFVVIIEKDKVDKELVNLKKQLQEKIDLAKAKDETKFTKKSFDALKAEIAKADSLKDSNDNEALKVALKDLQNSLDSLITIGDSSILEKKLEEALKLTKDESYTEDSRKTLENFLNRFAGYDFDNATEDDIKYDLKLVEEAVNKLVKKPSQVIVEVLVNKGGSSSDNLKGIIGKTFADLTSDSGSYKIEDPSISGKVFLGWKINDDSEILSSDALKSKVITQDMVKDGRIKISAEFNDEVKPSQEDAKTPKFTLEKKNKAIAIDRNNEDTKTWLNLLKGSTVTLSIYLSGEKLNFTTTNSLERGYYVYTNSSLGVRGINIGDIVKIVVPGYKDVFVKAEKFGRSYNLVQIENPETKENNNPSSENNNVQPSEGKNPKPNTQLKKIIFAESENRKIRLKKDHPDNGDWLSQIEEKALVKKLENNTFVDLNKGNIKIYNKTSTKSISIYNLKAGDIIKISLDGFEDVYLKAIKNGQSYQLVQIEKPNL
ncbi:MAG: hypothetical protein E6Y85_05530, partial [Peptoniphilus harei]|nr:hypothetical protein [Peptoniphilus harei]